MRQERTHTQQILLTLVSQKAAIVFIVAGAELQSSPHLSSLLVLSPPQTKLTQLQLIKKILEKIYKKHLKIK